VTSEQVILELMEVRLLAARPQRHYKLVLRYIHSHPYLWLVHLLLIVLCRAGSALRDTTWRDAGSCDCPNSRSATFTAQRFQLPTALPSGRARVHRSAAP
jgi:hypothetical protein